VQRPSAQTECVDRLNYQREESFPLQVQVQGSVRIGNDTRSMIATFVAADGGRPTTRSVGFGRSLMMGIWARRKKYIQHLPLRRARARVWAVGGVIVMWWYKSDGGLGIRFVWVSGR